MRAYNKKRKPKHTVKTVYKKGKYYKEYRLFENCKKVSIFNPLKFSLTVIKYNDYKFIRLAKNKSFSLFE